ncbi:MAG: transaldolase [Tetrasphaera sp.]
MTANANLTALTEAGVSVWLDDLSRERITSGNLKDVMEHSGVVGVTTNPSIFQAALKDGDAYAAQVAELAEAGTSVDDAVFAITTQDVRDACDVFRPIYDATAGQDGRVSIEVDPRLAHQEGATIEQAKALYAAVDRPNVMIKIPATIEGLPAITAVIGEGISVNVTLIFSLERYRAVMNAYLEGLERAQAAGKDLAQIRSVASFFVSRVDTEIDKRLDAIATPDALALKGRAAVANAQLAYQAYEEVFSTPRWAELEAAGAHKQRPLWASTGVKDPDYPDTLYVTDLVAANTVNTMPEKTLTAVIDHGNIAGDAVTAHYGDAAKVLDDIAAQGISYDEVTALLEQEGVDKFEQAWTSLLTDLQSALDAAK